MKHKVCLLFTFLSLSVSGISATNGQDSIRQIQLSDLEVQIRWVNPTAIRAYPVSYTHLTLPTIA